MAVAHLTRPRGNKGELQAVSLSDYPERFEQLKSVTVAGARYPVERVWYHKGQPVFKFRGIDSISAAECLAGNDVLVEAGERHQLAEGEYYFSDLMGCRIVDIVSGKALGTITGWQELGGPVVLEVDDGRILVPYAKAILQDIDIEAREIRAEIPEGLADLNA